MSCEPPTLVTLVRCPDCGSTNAGVDESQSMATLTYMLCNECGHGDHCNWWDKEDWSLESELIGDELPEYLEPLAARMLPV
jgi:hypothetical protein